MSGERPTRDECAIGVVVIGRNEGGRLRRCLKSLAGRAERIVYVDSGSTDDSVAFARSQGVDVIPLDMKLPFTMARGRNTGWRHLHADGEPVAFVQFVDGDCEIADGWIAHARDALARRPDVVAVYGRRRERFPEASIYNAMIDVEWDHPLGESAAFGGDVLIRTDGLVSVDGYDETMIAGEEPEMSVRLRAAGWKILRIDAEMTRHDAAIHEFGQWWKRASRSGHAYAEGAAKHGRGPSRHNVRALLSALFWGLAVPIAFGGLAGLALAFGRYVLAAAALLAWVLAHAYLVVRVRRSPLLRDLDVRTARTYAGFTVLAKFAHVVGIATYVFNRLRGRRTGLMEYKAVEQVDRS